MNAFTLALAYLRERWLVTALNALLLALGIATIAALFSFDHQFRDRLSRDARGIDLVVGAKGSPLQLVLSTVYHADIPTGNIRLSDTQPLLGHPMVQMAVPLALGDSVEGFRVVGTSPDFLTFRDAVVDRGRIWDQPLEAVLGAEVARRLGLAPGAELETAHGLSERGPKHEEHHYTVTGILAPTGTVMDRLVLTSLESVWAVHDKPGQALQTERMITGVLLKLKSPIAAVTLPAMINSQTPMLAASPAVETARLFALVGSGLDVLRGFGVILMASAGLGVFVALTGALERRRLDLAILRTLGASRLWVAGVLVFEGLALTLLGTVCGLVLGHAGLEIVARTIDQAGAAGLSGLVVAPAEAWLALGALIIGLAASLVPALRAYRNDVARILALG
jgi:putative ABC transport system permease protein